MSAHLHADDPEVVLLAAPHQERLARVVEDAAPRGPEPTRVGSLQKPVPFLDITQQKCIVYLMHLYRAQPQLTYII